MPAAINQALNKGNEPDHHPDWPWVKDLPAERKQQEIRRINHQASRQLKSNIEKHNLGYVKVRGNYAENYGNPENERFNDNEDTYLVMSRKKGPDSGAVHDFLVESRKEVPPG